MTGYRYATVVRLIMDDPRNENMDEGTVFLAEGKHEDGYSYIVVADEGFVDVECEALGVVGPAHYPMTKDDITSWAAGRDEAREIVEAAQ